MFMDGLWLSGITLNIERSGIPVPATMQSQPISVRLTPTQVNAICALLGVGMRNGELLMYNDDDLNRMILDDNDKTFEFEFKSINSGMKSNRRAFKVFTPAVDNRNIKDDAWDVDDTVKGDSEGFLSIDDVTEEASNI